jgi:L-amino acid N-acyltransferase YncA
MRPEFWPAVRSIYSQGIATGHATFETELPEYEEWDSSHRKDCRLVALETSNSASDDRLTPVDKVTILGWAALSPVSTRHVYRGVAEVSVYVAASARGKAVGKALLESLVKESEALGVWTLLAGIFPENAASIALHKSCGFREVGIRRRLGKLGAVWRDVLLLGKAERRRRGISQRLAASRRVARSGASPPSAVACVVDVRSRCSSSCNFCQSFFFRFVATGALGFS